MKQIWTLSTLRASVTKTRHWFAEHREEISFISLIEASVTVPFLIAAVAFYCYVLNYHWAVYDWVWEKI